MQLDYDILIDQKTGEMYAKITNEFGNTEAVSPGFQRDRKTVINWIVAMLAQINPNGPVRMTRKRVYNERVWERPMYWEITIYDAANNKLDSGQYRGVIQEEHLSELVREQFGFPLEAAVEVKL